MIPRLHKRGASFKGACGYILHGTKTTSPDRVLWAETCNIHSHADDAWFEMFMVARDQAELKQQAGRDARGRKNTKPVFHYSLSWAASDAPSPGHMRETALSSLRALGLEGHQAIIAAHGDKEHLHVHIMVNTVHPDTGLTAPLKYTKERLSRWAEAYEKEHGIHCEQRIKNNEERRRLSQARANEALGIGLAKALGIEPPARAPYVPVKYTATGRQQWMERKALFENIKELRDTLAQEHRRERDTTWKQQVQERDWLDRNSRAAADHAREHVRNQYRARWRTLYTVHRREERHVSRVATHPLERAVFVYANRERLGRGKALSVSQMLSYIRSGARLAKCVAQVQTVERRALARAQKLEAKGLTDRIWALHREKFAALRDRQQRVRQAQRETQSILWRDMDVAWRSVRSVEREPPPIPTLKRAVTYQKAANDVASKPGNVVRIDRLRQDMEQWRKRNAGKDYGREM